MSSGSSGSAQGRPKGRVPFVDLSTLADEWDTSKEIRTRIREAGKLMPEKAMASVDISACCHASDVLPPLISRMVMADERPLPQIDALRESIQALFEKNKRTEAAETEDEIMKTGWMIRKLLGFIKMKVRRKEPSKVPRTGGCACEPLKRDLIALSG